MTNKDYILPFYIKASLFFIGLCALIAILYVAQSIIIPLIFAFIIAILLSPVVSLFVRLKVNRILAIAMTLLLTIIIIFACGAFVVSQASLFADSWPTVVEKFTLLLNNTISQAAIYFDVKPQHIHEWINKTQGELINFNGAAVGQTLMSVGGAVAVLFIIPVYIFVILYYQPLLLEFIRRLFADNHQTEVTEIVSQTKTVVQRYLVGLIIEAAIIATLDASALLILGIDYAILLGIIAAFLNMIPYIGGIVAVALPMMVALATKESPWSAVYILISYYVIQLFDNNYVVPKIVASKVKINALFSIIVVLVGNMLWGVPGMFLSIPLLAIIKLIFDHIESLKPWGFLLGDAMPPLRRPKKPKPRKMSENPEPKQPVLAGLPDK
jgi:predicted PurR-regulated permease PerM